MVGQIGPLVQVGRRKLALAFHVLGGVAGGAAIGVVLGFAGLLLRAAIGESLDTVFLVVVPAALLYAAAVDLGVLHVRPLTWERQTPGRLAVLARPLSGHLRLGLRPRPRDHDTDPVPDAARAAPRSLAGRRSRHGGCDHHRLRSIAGARRRRSGFDGRRRLRSGLRRDPEPGPAAEASRRLNRACNRSPDRDFLTEGGR